MSLTLSERKALYRNRVESQETTRDYVIDTVGVWGPLLAPAVPAALTMVSIAMHYPELLHIHWLAALVIGLIVAIVIEVLGVVSVETFLDMQSYNQVITEEEESAPAGWAGAIMALYIAIVISLVVLLKMVPALALVSLVPLTLLAGVTSWIVVMRKQHRERVYRKEMAVMELERKNDLSALIAQLRAELETERQKREKQLAAMQEMRAQSQKLQAENSRLSMEISVMQSALERENPANFQKTVADDPVAVAEKSAEVRKLRKGERQAWIENFLRSDCAGLEISSIDKQFLSEKFSVTPKTIGTDIGAIQQRHGWNGRIPIVA